MYPNFLLIDHFSSKIFNEVYEKFNPKDKNNIYNVCPFGDKLKSLCYLIE